MADRIPLAFGKNISGAAVSIDEMPAGDKIPAIYLTAQAPNLHGTYAARPSASSVPPGTAYYASDTLEAYRSNGSVWLLFGRGGAEIGFAASSVSFSTASTTFVDVPGLAFSYVAGEGSCLVTFGASIRALGNLGGTLGLFVDGVQIGQCISAISTYSTVSSNVKIAGKTPGSIVAVKLMMLTSNASSTIEIYGGSTDKPYVRAVTC